MRPPSARASKRQSWWGRLLLVFYFTLLIALGLALMLLWKSGQVLVAKQPMEHARWAFVMPGESAECEASDAAVKLMADERIDTLVLVGGRLYKTRWITEVAKRYVENEGAPGRLVFEMRVDATSTLDAVRQVVRLARLQNLDTVTFVTSSFHSRQVKLFADKLAGGMPVVQIVAAESPVFMPSAWWATSQSKAIWFREWVGLAHAWLTGMNMKPDPLAAEVRNLLPDPWLDQEFISTKATLPDTLVLPKSGDSTQAQGLLDSAAKVLDSLRKAPVLAELKDTVEGSKESSPRQKTLERDSSRNSEVKNSPTQEKEAAKARPKEAVKPAKEKASARTETTNKKNAKKEKSR